LRAVGMDIMRQNHAFAAERRKDVRHIRRILLFVETAGILSSRPVSWL
jgi:hypothetical protein